MESLRGELTQKSLIKLVFLGVILMAATATATYLVTEQGNDRTPAQAAGFIPQASRVSGAASSPAQGQPGVLYVYDPTQGFVPVSQPGQGFVLTPPRQAVDPQPVYPNGPLQGVGLAMVPVAAGPGLQPSSQVQGSSWQDTRPASGTVRTRVRTKVVHVHHHHVQRVAASSSASGSRQNGGLLSGMSRTTKWALIGGALGAGGGALIGGRGKHKAANGALAGAAIGTVTGGLLGHALENR